ncbi:hypothetical protein A3770_09p56360 [Chloropicon primus]|uniref:EF-hand domain-containing protein n=1 Tax=Chloropicon primus TaxID=1764295 RepID=A0A5B8MQX1_9CHLO|nr:hypothetical protein A3770_09p56360 [Chloropicon primus]|eukprot:QDZ23118.1 hypothetical protein A3770_09p56360 [Chloropicon primus]
MAAEQEDHDLSDGAGGTSSSLAVPRLAYHAVPVLLLNDEGDLSEFDIRDKLRVCFEESEEESDKETQLKVLTQEDIDSLVVDGEEKGQVAFSTLVERQIDKDVAALEKELWEKAEHARIEREEAEKAAKAAEEGGGDDGAANPEEAANTEEAQEEDDAQPAPQEPPPEVVVSKTCLYICKYALSEREMEGASSQSLRYPLSALAYVHGKVEEPEAAEGEEPVAREPNEVEKLFKRLKEVSVTEAPNTWTLDVALIECEAEEQSSYESLKRDLLKVSSCVGVLKGWQDSTLFLNVPDHEEVRLGYYKQLADSVPLSSCSVPVLLHCMLEQVAQNAESDVKVSPEKSLADKAGELFDSIIGGMEEDPEPVEKDKVDVVFELSQTLKGSPRKSRKKAAKFALLETKEVEERMCKLTGIPGTGSFGADGGKAAISQEDRATRMTSREYFCEKHALPLSTLEHREQLSEAAGCLPEAHKSHRENILGRRHVEILDAGSAAQSIMHSSSVLPSLKSKYLDLEDATLLVLSASSKEDAKPNPSLPLPVRLQDAYNGQDTADSSSWPEYVYDICIPVTDIMERNTPKEIYPCEGSRVCTYSDDAWTLCKGINTLHYSEKGLQGTTIDGSSVVISGSDTQVVLEEGVVLSINEDGTLAFTHVEEQEESCWTILRNGTVVKSEFKTGKKVVMLPDGCIGKYESDTETWTRVNSKGEQWSERPAPPQAAKTEPEEGAEEGTAEPAEAEAEAAAEEEAEAEEGEKVEEEKVEEEKAPEFERVGLPTLSIARVRDPDTGAYVLTREDLTMMIQYEEGHKLSLFSDGTRMITYSSGVWETMLQLKNISLLFKGDGNQISIGKLTVDKAEEGGISIKIPFDSSVLEVEKSGEDAIFVKLGDFHVDVGSGSLRHQGKVLWEKSSSQAQQEEEVKAAESSAAAAGEEGSAAENEDENAEAPGEEEKVEEEGKEPAEEEGGEENADQGEDQQAEEEEEQPVLDTAARFKPRVFKVYSSGEAVEFIDEESFQGIKEKAESRGDQHISEADIHNSETSTVPVSHTFLSESDVSGSKGIVVAHNIAGESQAPRALQTLTVPSAITFAYVGNHSVPLPMISAIPSDADTCLGHSKVLLVRQVQEFPKIEDKEIASVEEVLKDLSEFDLVNEETSPSTYIVPESQHGSNAADIKKQISATSEKIKRLRLAKANDSRSEPEESDGKAPSGKEGRASLLKEDSNAGIRERPKQGVLLPYFGSEEAEEITAEELERKKNAPHESAAGVEKYLTTEVTYDNIQKLDSTLDACFKHSYDDLRVFACALGMAEDEMPESQKEKEKEWTDAVRVAKGICEGGSSYEKKYESFAGESVQTQIRRHFLSNMGVGLDILELCLKSLKAQRYLELFADIESTSRVDTALEALFEILNYDFPYLSDLLVQFKTALPADNEEVIQAAERASKTCSSVSPRDGIENIFKHLRSDVLLAGAAGAAMLDDLLDCLNLEKKKKDFMKLFVQVDSDDDGYLTNEEFKSLIPKLNTMLLSTDAIEESEVSETFDGNISISDCIDFLFQKQTQNSPLFPSELHSEETNFTMYSKSVGENEFSSFKDIAHVYDTTRVSSNKVAPCVMNAEYLSIEGETRRTLKTGLCSMQKMKLQEGMAVKNFQMTPAYLFLGRLEPGASAKGRLTLQNVGPEAARFNVGNVDAPFELHYTPGLLAAGMKRFIDIEVKIPEQADPEQGDCYCTEVVIKTECNILYCVVAAKGLDRSKLNPIT